MSRSRGHGQKFDRLKDAALAALLSEPTVTAAAQKIGVDLNTLTRWMQEPEFSSLYRAARRQVVEAAVSNLQQATSEAVDALRRNLTCGTPAAEIAAAKAVIDFAVKGVELTDLAERVEQLEQAAELAAGRKA